MEGIPQLINSMVYNICENAIKYNRPGGSVVIQVAEFSGHPRISVRDTGIGIPKKDRARIFERFYRVDKSHSKEVGGTGLGLSIVKHAAKLHNADGTYTETATASGRGYSDGSKILKNYVVGRIFLASHFFFSEKRILLRNGE